MLLCPCPWPFHLLFSKSTEQLIFRDPSTLWGGLSLIPLSCNIKCLSLGTLAVNTVVHVHVVLLLFVCTLTILAKQQANPWKVGATCFSFFIPVIQCSIWHMADIHLVFLDTAPKEVWLFFPVANEETVLWVPESGLKFRPGWFQNPCSFYYAMPFLNETMLN